MMNGKRKQSVRTHVARPMQHPRNTTAVRVLGVALTLLQLNMNSITFWKRPSKLDPGMASLPSTSQLAAARSAKRTHRALSRSQLAAAFSCGSVAALLGVCLLAWTGQDPLGLLLRPSSRPVQRMRAAVAPLALAACADTPSPPAPALAALSAGQCNCSGAWQDRLIIAARHDEARPGVACSISQGWHACHAGLKYS